MLEPGATLSWLISSSTAFLMSRTPVPFGTSTGSHVRSFGGSASTSSFDRRSMTPWSCTVSSSTFDAPRVCHPYSFRSAAQ